MALREFGRRQALPAGAHSATATGASPAASADLNGALALADAPSRSATRSLVVLAGVGALVVVMALGAAYGLSAAISPGNGLAAADSRQCNGQAGCVNQYNVALTCGASEQPKSVVVEASDAEAAQRKAERYNRDCRSRRVVFVTSLIRSAVHTALSGQRVDEPERHASRNATPARRAWRFRRR